MVLVLCWWCAESLFYTSCNLTKCKGSRTLRTFPQNLGLSQMRQQRADLLVLWLLECDLSFTRIGFTSQINEMTTEVWFNYLYAQTVSVCFSQAVSADVNQAVSEDRWSAVVDIHVAQYSISFQYMYKYNAPLHVRLVLIYPKIDFSYNLKTHSKWPGS